MSNFQRSRVLPVGVRRGERRKTLWIGGSFVDTQIAAASGSVLVTQLSASALALLPFTIVRTRGFVFFRSDQQAASENPSGSYGVIVVKQQASTIGITAIPTPVTDDTSDWFAFQAMAARLTFSDATGIQTPAGIYFPIDSKAMRKVDVGDDVVEVLENSALVGGIQCITYTKLLVKLH